MLLNSIVTIQTEPRAQFLLADKAALIDFGAKLSALLGDDMRAKLGMDSFTVGMIAPPATGKSTLTRGIYQGLGSEYSPLQMGMIACNGVWDTQSLKGGLIRHFDLAVHVDDDDDNFPAHWRTLEAGLQAPGIELVEHALKFRDERYICLLKMAKGDDAKSIQINLYCTDELAASVEYQNLMEYYQAAIPPALPVQGYDPA